MTKNNNSYLIVGSAPYVSDWWNLNGEHILKSSLKLCPMNNAWSIIGPENTHCWFTARDFFATGTLIPTDEQMIKMAYIRGISKATDVNPNSKLVYLEDISPNIQEAAYLHGMSRGKELEMMRLGWREASRAYKRNLMEFILKVNPDRKEITDGDFSGTTFLNVASSLIWAASNKEEELRIYVIGSDFDYGNGNHFYEDNPEYKGTQDPLRFGEEWLTHCLLGLTEKAARFNTSFFNLSSNPDSLLPFPKVDITEIL